MREVHKQSKQKGEEKNTRPRGELFMMTHLRETKTWKTEGKPHPVNR